VINRTTEKGSGGATGKSPQCPTCSKPVKGWKQSDKEEAITQLALWSIRKNTHADIALLQKRDFYVKAVDEFLAGQAGAADPPPDMTDWDSKIQEVLSRVIWKGDHLAIKSVQGSVLKKILAQSKQFADTEKNSWVVVGNLGVRS
jgi:hypothetical protein